MDLEKILFDLHEKGETAVTLSNGTVVTAIAVTPGPFPQVCFGTITALVNGVQVSYPFPLPCTHCGGCG